MILSVGELLWDLHVAPGTSLETGEQLRRVPGGATANVAMQLAKSGHPVAVAGTASDDALGRGLCAALEALGVDASRVDRVPGRTGLVFLERTEASSERSVSYRPTVGPFRGCFRLDGLQALHISALNPNTEELRAYGALAANARALGAWVLIDVNARPLPWREPLDAAGRAALATLAGHAHAIKVSAGDLERLGASLDEPLDVLEAAGTTIFLTRGGDPTEIRGPWGSFECTPPKVELVRSIGAGDAFCAGVLAALRRLPAEALAQPMDLWRSLLDAGHQSAAVRVSSAW